jgi:hypothetical protein
MWKNRKKENILITKFKRGVEYIIKCIDKIQEAWNKLMYKLMFKLYK